MLHSVLSGLNRVVSSNKLSILIYHQVLAEFDPLRPFEVTAEQFDWQMQLLAKHFTPISLSDAKSALDNDALPNKAVCVTFDDGYLNNLTVAQPILEKYKIPATVYVATGFSQGLSMWNDRVMHLFSDIQVESLLLEGKQVELGNWELRRELAGQQLMRLKYLPIKERLDAVQALYDENRAEAPKPLMMDPQQIKLLAELGVEIGGHTVNHPILKVLSKEQQLEEVSQCKSDLEAWTGKTVKHFAYPNGAYGKDLTDETIDVVKNTGYETAVVTDWGTCSPGDNLLTLKRFTPWDRTPIKFHARLVKSRLG